MSMIRKKYHVYPAWRYQDEIEDLNKESAAGWQLIEGGFISNRFVYDKSTLYRYQIDYIGSGKDSLRYFELFAEQGWEHVNSLLNGWHYFRKKYSPEMDESEFQIYTEREELPGPNTRWGRVAKLLMLIWSALCLTSSVHMIMTPKIMYIPMLLLNFTCLFAFGYGYVMMQTRRHHKKASVISKLAIPSVVLFVILNSIFITLGTDSSASAQGMYFVHDREEIHLNDFFIKLPDFYYLDANLEAEEGISLAIINEKGDAIYTLNDGESIKNIRIWMPRGKYKVVLQQDESELRESISFNYQIH